MKTIKDRFEECDASGVKWPFASMEVGDVVSFDIAEFPRAQTYAHVYARQAGKAMSTRTDSEAGVVYVKRIK